MVVPKAWMATLILLLVVLSGCLQGEPDPMGEDPEDPEDRDPLEGPQLSLNGTLTFQESVVGPAVHYGIGLYEPTIDVSDSGVIYISAHTAGVDTTGAPAFYSDDDAAIWQQLPFAGPATAPEPIHGGTPPPSDEIFIIAGDNGQAWGVDITLLTFPVNGWCGDGAEHCYHNPNAYNRADTADSCSAASLNDRPWAAYANGTLLMVNNPGGGPVQVGAMAVPPEQPVGLANPVTGPTWNMCASSGGSIPGIPDMRDDHFFAVPQMQGDELVIVTGNADDVMDVQEHKVFNNTNVGVSEIGEYGQAVFDADGTLYIAAMNNADDSGGVHLAVSTDDGQTFTEHRYTFDEPVSSIYLDGNDHGPGAVINWGLMKGETTDWYLGHLFMNEHGQPVVRNASLAVEDGPEASRHVQGAAVGPDGRAYMVLSEVSGNDQAESLMQAGITPLRVVVQKEGARLPVSHDEMAEPEEIPRLAWT